MSILIKGIDLPKDGWYLDLVITDDGVVRYYGDEDEMQIAKAVELPDHGDLIDREAVVTDLSKTLLEAVASAPVIIPAERSEASLCDYCDERSENCCWCKKMEGSEE